MAIFRGTQIRGSQIVDRTVEGQQILQQSLLDEHIANNASISESKLNIDWHSHTEALEDRKIVDFVQANGISVSGTNINLEAVLPNIVGTAKANSTDNIEGILVDYPKNAAPMRDSITGDPIVATINGVDYEVVARVEFDSNYKLSFYTASGVDGAEVAYDLGATPVNIDFQYARRFNLRNVDEMFASNEKFVYGAADVTAYLNIEQIAKDVYGSSWSVDRDGNSNLTISIQDQINNEKVRAQTAETALTNSLADEVTNRTQADATLQTALDNEVIRAKAAEGQLQTNINSEQTARENADQTLTNNLSDEVTNRTNADLAIRNDFASVDPGRGAGLVGIAPISGLTATTVQSALQELKVGASDGLVNFETNIASTEVGKGASLVGVDASKGLNGSNVEAVLEDHENRLDTLEGNATVTGSVDNKIKVEVTDVLASNAVGQGANTVAVQSGTGLEGSTIQAVLVNHENRLDTVEANLAASGSRNASAFGYFAAQTFATVDARFDDDEVVIDANLKRIDDRDLADRTRIATFNGFFGAKVATTLNSRFEDVENVVDGNAQEIKVARGSETDLNARLSKTLRADGVLLDDAKIHVHKKYTFTVAANQSGVTLPIGEYFNISTATGSGSVSEYGVQVYINGILQANGINFTEVADAGNATHGVAIDFSPEELVAGDVIVIEYVNNNNN